MKRQRRSLKWLMVLWFLMALAFLLGLQWNYVKNTKQRTTLAGQLEDLLPSRHEGNPEDYSQYDMPVVQLQERDYVGLLQIPAFGITLPIQNTWDTKQLDLSPCRYWGSVYNNTMVIGGRDHKGQLQVLEQLDLDESITFTDMTGATFSYEVCQIQRSNDAGAEKLINIQWDLVLFVRDTSTGDYLLVQCLLAP